MNTEQRRLVRRIIMLVVVAAGLAFATACLWPWGPPPGIPGPGHGRGHIPIHHPPHP